MAPKFVNIKNRKMSKVFYILGFILLSMGLKAQLPDGSTAPDWTLTDINGNSHHLYSYLDSGYTVYIDFSATWCGPCWYYHNSGALENLYLNYGPNGTNEVRVFFIEGDASTNLACLYGASGCNSSTQGNWVDGTPYPIINDASQTGAYQVPWWPTIYGICSNHEITYLGQQTTAGLYAFRSTCPAPANIDITLENVQDAGCSGQADGAIDISVSGGSGNYSYAWSNGSTSQDLVNVTSGFYSVTVTDGNTMATGSLTDIYVDQVGGVSLTQTFYQPVSCQNGGNNGAVGYAASGGTPGYIYEWSNGSFSSTLSGVGPGTYVLTVTDNGGCSAMATVVFDSPNYPTAVINPNYTPLDCQNSTTTLDGSGSSFGTYEWTTTDGLILSSTTSSQVTVGTAGTYTLTVTNSEGCTSSASITVVSSGDALDVFVFPQGAILSCNQPEVDLVATSSMVGVTYLWTGPMGFSASTSTVTVDLPGTYTVVVTKPTTGCTASTDVNVGAAFDVPNIDVNLPVGSEVTCTNPTISLIGSSTTNNVSFSWILANGDTTYATEILVVEPGDYTFYVEGLNGCVASETVTITGSITPPDVYANFVNTEILSCLTTSLDIVGGSSTPNVTYSWSGPGGFTASTPTITVVSPGDYTLTVFNGFEGCESATTLTVLDDTSPPANVSVSASEILDCAHPSVVLSAHSTTGNVVYSWQTPTGNTLVGADVSVTEPGVYIMTATNPGNGCSLIMPFNLIGDFIAPSVSVTSSATELSCNVTSIDLFATSTGNTYEWIGPNGFTSSTAAVSVQMAGTYTVVVTGSNGCTNNTSIVIAQAQTINISCFAQADVTTPYGNDGVGSVIATAGTAPYVAVLNGDSQTIQDTGGSASFSGLTSGVYTVVVTDANGCSMDCSFTISEPGCTLSLSETHQDETCLGYSDGSIDITAAGANGTVSYSWSNGAITEDLSGLSAGIFTVVATDESECQANLAVNISTTTPLSPTFDLIGPFCQSDEPFNLSTTSEEGITGTWNINPFDPANGSATVTFTPNAGQCATAVNMDIVVTDLVVPVFSNFGPYCDTDAVVTLPSVSMNGIEGTWAPLVIDPAAGNQIIEFTPLSGQCAASYVQSVVVENCGCTNPPLVDAGASQVICGDDAAQLSGSIGGGATTATWSGGAGTYSPDNTALDAIYTPTAAELLQDSLTLFLTTDDPDGAGPCEASTSTVLLVFVQPINSIEVDSILCCDNESVEILVNSECGGTYLWNNGLTSNPISVAIAGTYSVTVVCALGCTDSISVEVEECSRIEEVDASTTPASGETIADGGATVESVSGGTAPYTIEWYFNGALISTELSIENVLPGEYRLVVIDTNGCQLRMLVHIGFATATEAPDWGEGLRLFPNPSEGVFYLEIDKLSDIHISVQNALGEMVYQRDVVPFGKIAIDLSEFSQGVYFLKLENKDGYVYRKLTVER